MHHLHLLYLRYISFTSPTSSTPTSTSHLQLFTSSISTWSSSTSSTSIAQELLRRNCHTGVMTHKLSYRIPYTGVLAQDSKSRWSACIWNLPSSYFSSSSKLSPLAAGAARRQLTKRDPLRNMWWNANFVGVAVPFCTKWGRESPTGVNF